jgi:hypothetical protein
MAQCGPIEDVRGERWRAVENRREAANELSLAELNPFPDELVVGLYCLAREE